jgi:hypothetical protein
MLRGFLFITLIKKKMNPNWNSKNSNKKLTLFLVICVFINSLYGQVAERNIYQIKVYSLENEQQELRMDNYLKQAYLPALHRIGINHVGVFKPIEESELAAKSIYVFIPFKTISQFEELEALLNKDEKFLEDGRDYIYATYDNAPYVRIESILLRAFKSMPAYGVPTHTTPQAERIYELRSYQGATEKLYEKKVDMFTDGGESKIFIDLEFQPIFFAEVISGPIMPNLMYLTTFKNKESQENHWNAFRSSPEWLSLKSDTQYDNVVSKIDKIFLFPTDYSDL